MAISNFEDLTKPFEEGTTTPVSVENLPPKRFNIYAHLLNTKPEILRAILRIVNQTGSQVDPDGMTKIFNFLEENKNNPVVLKNFVSRVNGALSNIPGPKDTVYVIDEKKIRKLLENAARAPKEPARVQQQPQMVSRVSSAPAGAAGMTVADARDLALPPYAPPPLRPAPEGSVVPPPPAADGSVVPPPAPDGSVVPPPAAAPPPQLETLQKEGIGSHGTPSTLLQAAVATVPPPPQEPGAPAAPPPSPAAQPVTAPGGPVTKEKMEGSPINPFFEGELTGGGIIKELLDKDSLTDKDIQENIDKLVREYPYDYQYGPEAENVNMTDRVIFVATTYIVRAISLFMVEWGIHTGFINNFIKAFSLYFGVYVSVLILLYILTNANLENYLFRTLFYYINGQTENGKGNMRIGIHVLCLLFLFPVPFVVREYRQINNKNLTFTEKRSILNGVEKFTLIAWVLTSIVALRV